MRLPEGTRRLEMVQPGEDQEPTLRDIMKKLEQQDRQAMRTVYLAGAMWGGSITIGAVFLWITNLSGISFMVNYAFFLVAGFIFMAYWWYKLRKIKQ